MVATHFLSRSSENYRIHQDYLPKIWNEIIYWEYLEDAKVPIPFCTYTASCKTEYKPNILSMKDPSMYFGGGHGQVVVQ